MSPTAYKLLLADRAKVAQATIKGTQAAREAMLKLIQQRAAKQNERIASI